MFDFWFSCILKKIDKVVGENITKVRVQVLGQGIRGDVSGEKDKACNCKLMETLLLYKALYFDFFWTNVRLFLFYDYSINTSLI